MDRQALHDRIENDFMLHPPAEGVGPVMDRMRTYFKELAHTIVDTVPISREQSMALSEMEVALFHTIAALARYQDKVLEEVDARR